MAYARKRKGVTRAATRVAGRVARNSSLVQRKQKKSVKIAAARQLKLTPVAKELIRREIKPAEYHNYQFTNLSNANFDGPITSGDINSLAPNLASGSSIAQFSGDKLKLRSVTINAFLRCAVLPSSTQDDGTLYVRMLVFTPKQHMNNNEFTLADKLNTANYLLQQSDQELSYDGTFYRHILPYNRSRVTVHYSRTFEVRMERTTWNVTGLPGYSETAQDTRPWIKHVKVNLKVRNKILKFDGQNQFPQNFNPCIAFGFVNAKDGGATPDTNTRVNASVFTRYVWDPN